MGPPEVVTELSSPLEDTDAWVSPDGRYIMLTRELSSDPCEIYEAFR